MVHLQYASKPLIQMSPDNGASLIKNTYPLVKFTSLVYVTWFARTTLQYGRKLLKYEPKSIVPLRYFNNDEEQSYNLYKDYVYTLNLLTKYAITNLV